MKSHKNQKHEIWNLITKIMHLKSIKSHKEIPQRHKKHENHVRKSHAKNEQHKAWSRIKVARPEKETEFIHSQRKTRRRKNPDQNTVTGKEGKLKLYAQPTKSMKYHKEIP
jgi:hypothetical protein